ncbi:MAG: hypothetical protein C0513_02710 [Isosphaera sp.]|nr:hypothetical protein [Isosphaera sp.]
MFDDPSQVRRSDGPSSPSGPGGFPRLRTDDANDPYDLLTDLFVGPEPTSAPEPRAPLPASESAPPLRNEPGPIALGNPSAVPEPARVTREAPAHGSQPRRGTDGGDGVRCRGATVELLIAGNLPTLAAAWVSQYARSAAALAGEPVALVRLTGATLRVEIHGEPATLASQATERAALRAAALCCRRVIVHGEADTALAAACGDGEHQPDEVSVLFGCDEAGVVSAYRAVKRLAAAWSRAGGAGPSQSGAGAGEAELPARPRGVTLVPIGSAAAKAAQASRRIEDAARSFLTATVRCTAPIERVTAGAPARPLLDSAATLSLIDVLAALRQAAPGTSAQRPGEPDAPEPAPPEPAPQARSVVTRAGAPLLDAVPATRSDPARSAPAHAATRPTHQPMKHTHATAPLSSSLSELIDADGPLVLLRARCPHAPGVELALDAMGTLHALRDDTAHDAVADLVAALGWAAEHAAVLSLTTTEPVDTAAAPVGHFFTRRPSEARRLVPGSVRVHALAQTRSGEWAAVEL